MKTIHVAGLDVAFANFGMARAEIDIDVAMNMYVNVTDLKLITTEGLNKKTVRKSSDDLRRAREILEPLKTFCLNFVGVAFAEVPSGSQQARSSWGLGISVGVLASCPVPVIQVSQLEVKMATVGKKTASKQEMIEWAVARHPAAPWLYSKKRLVAANEHLADAVATIYAGMKTDEFKRLVALLSQPNDGGETARKMFQDTHYLSGLGAGIPRYKKRKLT
jgi:hypothetical protein